MKLNKYILSIAALAVAMGFTACQDDIDAPKFKVPEAQYSEGDLISIYDLKMLYWEDDVNYIDTIPFVYNDIDDITGVKTRYPRNADGSRKTYARNFVIKGRVISSDVAGNVYKKVVIQDRTAAIAFSVNRGNMSSLYNFGQEIVVDCNGLYLGKYNGGQQFGYPSYYDKQDVYNATFMPYDFFASHIQLNGLPEPAKVDTLQIASVADLPSSPAEFVRYQSNIARFHNVFFEEGGIADFCSAHKVNTNRNIFDYPDGTTAQVVRTSGYSKFWAERLPAGEIDIVAICDYYQSNPTGNGTWQLTLNGLDGILNPSPIFGTESSPYTVEQVIDIERAGSNARGWMTGYIVGAVAMEVTSVTSNADIQFAADVDMNNTLVIGPTADCKDFAECVVISLPQGSALRQYGNLRDNPANYGKQIWVSGILEKYMDTWGITGNSGDASQWRIDGVAVGGAGIPDGAGTQASPLSPTQIVKLNPTSTTASPAGYESVWVEGYIVGYMPSDQTYLSNTLFGIPTDVKTNIVIAPSADCTDVSKCVGIQLPSGAIRSALNLQDNPGNLGALVKLQGSVMKYCGGPGLKTLTAYELVEGGASNPDTPVDPTPGSGDGSQANPYAVSQVIALNPTSTTASPDGGAGVWVNGFIVGYMPSNQTYLSNTIFGVPTDVKTNIVLGPTADCTDYTLCIGIQLPSGALRTAINLADNPDNLGKQVSLYGDVMKYCGGPGLKNTSKYEFGQGGGTSTPDNPATGDTVYSGLIANADGWTFDNVTIPEAASYIWSWKEYNGSGYLNASCYVSGAAYASEAYAYTTVDLTGVSGAKVTFDHAAKFQTTLKDLCGLVVREAGSSAWTRLAIPTWPDAGAWTFVNSGEISLNAFSGKKIEIGFVYGSTASGADTWEIKNFLISK